MFNVNELLLCALPYHATPEFARLLVLLQLKGSGPWEWLSPGQQSGAPPPRDVIVRRCVNDQVGEEDTPMPETPAQLMLEILSQAAVRLC